MSRVKIIKTDIKNFFHRHFINTDYIVWSKNKKNRYIHYLFICLLFFLWWEIFAFIFILFISKLIIPNFTSSAFLFEFSQINSYFLVWTISNILITLFYPILKERKVILIRKLFKEIKQKMDRL